MMKTLRETLKLQEEVNAQNKVGINLKNTEPQPA
jgi:hypothetical protein